MNYNLSKRTPGEDLWLKRRGSKHRIAELFASRIGVCRTTLWRYENDLLPVPPGICYEPPDLSRAGLSALARRRSGLGLTGAAAAAKCSRPVYLLRENQGFLMAFWRKRGFRFPKISMK